jgi:hypothetical protein
MDVCQKGLETCTHAGHLRHRELHAPCAQPMKIVSVKEIKMAGSAAPHNVQVGEKEVQFSAKVTDHVPDKVSRMLPGLPGNW